MVFSSVAVFYYLPTNNQALTLTYILTPNQLHEHIYIVTTTRGGWWVEHKTLFIWVPVHQLTTVFSSVGKLTTYLLTTQVGCYLCPNHVQVSTYLVTFTRYELWVGQETLFH